MLKVEGAIDIIAHCAENVQNLTVPTFRSNHTHFSIHEDIGQVGKYFLAVEQAVSQPECTL